MKCRQVLLKTRQDRALELKSLEEILIPLHTYSEQDWIAGKNDALKASLSAFKKEQSLQVQPIKGHENQLKHRQEILALELPFKTDTVSVNQALVNSYPNETHTGYRDMVEWLKRYYPYEGTGESLDYLFQQKYVENLFDSAWSEIVITKYSPDGEESVAVHKASMEDFVMQDVLDRFLINIRKSELKESSKKVLCSLLKSMIRYCHNQDRAPASPVCKTSKSDLAHYFDYLEERCLKSNLEIPYKQLLGVRLLFYTSLSPKQLQTVNRRCIDSKNKCVQYKGILYPVPETFISLAKALFSMDEPIFGHTSKTLNKFVNQTASSAGLKRITPTSIKKSREYLYHTEQMHIQKLPRR